MKIDMIKKKVIKIIATFILAISFIGVKNVSAYTFPKDDYYIIMDVQTFGTIKIHVPKNQIELLQITEDYKNVVNISSGTVYGYCHIDSTEYRVTFATYSQNTIRETNASYGAQTYDLNINMIIDTNIPHLKNEKTIEDILSTDNEKVLFIILILILFVGVLRWLKH